VMTKYSECVRPCTTPAHEPSIPAGGVLAIARRHENRTPANVAAIPGTYCKMRRSSAGVFPAMRRIERVIWL
jgi:hypothetical protein